MKDIPLSIRLGVSVLALVPVMGCNRGEESPSSPTRPNTSSIPTAISIPEGANISARGVIGPFDDNGRTYLAFFLDNERFTGPARRLCNGVDSTYWEKEV